MPTIVSAAGDHRDRHHDEHDEAGHERAQELGAARDRAAEHRRGDPVHEQAEQERRREPEQVPGVEAPAPVVVEIVLAAGSGAASAHLAVDARARRALDAAALLEAARPRLRRRARRRAARSPRSSASLHVAPDLSAQIEPISGRHDVAPHRALDHAARRRTRWTSLCSARRRGEREVLAGDVDAARGPCPRCASSRRSRAPRRRPYP